MEEQVFWELEVAHRLEHRGLVWEQGWTGRQCLVMKEGGPYMSS